MQASERSTNVMLLAGTLLAYCATPWFGFVYDDRKQVVANPGIAHLQSIPGFFTHAGGYLVGDVSYYRPLFGAWLSLNHFLFALHPAGWHLAELVLHVAVVFLCYRATRAIFQDENIALVAALLFAVHPVHVESVAWISGGTDPLAALFVLSALLLLLSGSNWKSMALGPLALFASLLCKETALLFPLLILCYELLPGRTGDGRLLTALRRSAPYFAVVVAYLVLRIRVLGGFSHTLTPLSFKELTLTLPSVGAFYTRLLFLPAGLSPFYDTPYVKAFSFRDFVLPLLVLVALVAVVVYWIIRTGKSQEQGEQRRSAAIFFALWTILFLLPAFNLTALDPGEIAHDRYLYLPSIGVCALAAMALKQLAEKLTLSASIGKFAVAGMAVILCSATFAQSLFWRNDRCLYLRGAAIAPDNINALNNVANIYLEDGDYSRGIEAHEKILKMNPQFAPSYFNLGMAYYNRGNFTQAQLYLQQAVGMRPSGEGYFYLGLTQLKKGDLFSAVRSLENATRMDEKNSRYHAALGVTYELQGQIQPALRELDQAAALDPGNPGLRNEAAKLRARQPQM